jgi:hypothetical protein
MLRKIFLVVSALIFISANLLAQKTAPPLAANPKFSFGILFGYTNQFGVNLSGTISEFSYDIPLAVKFSAGYNLREPGDPLRAREIFINDNTNGDPAESGHNFDLRLDFAYPINILSIRKSYLLVGPRYSMHTSTFEFVGGNEFFDITSSQFGVGAGLETYFGISPNLSFVFSGGFDYYFDAQIGGHDSAYNPDGTEVSGREDFTYTDADNAINQPKYEFRFMAGLSFGL